MGNSGKTDWYLGPTVLEALDMFKVDVLLPEYQHRMKNRKTLI